MSRPAVQRLFQFSAVLGSKQLDALSFGIRTDLNRAYQTTSQDSWSSQRFGFATASLLGLGAGCMAFASSSAANADVETATIGDIKITASGGAKIRRDVVFVLGGPGSGKGTQCLQLVNEFQDIAHFSAGDLLRELVKSGTPEGEMVASMIKEGKIVPSEVTINLLQRAMAASGKTRILIDGFPRNLENRDAFERVAGYDCKMVLFFDCPEEVMEKRLLGRNQGRSDDNIETIRKRFKVFLQSTLPVIEYYEKLGKVKRIAADKPPTEVYADVRTLFA